MGETASEARGDGGSVMKKVDAVEKWMKNMEEGENRSDGNLGVS